MRKKVLLSLLECGLAFFLCVTASLAWFSLNRHNTITEHRLQVAAENNLDINCNIYPVTTISDQSYTYEKIFLEDLALPAYDIANILGSKYKKALVVEISFYNLTSRHFDIYLTCDTVVFNRQAQNQSLSNIISIYEATHSTDPNTVQTLSEAKTFVTPAVIQEVYNVGTATKMTSLKLSEIDITSNESSIYYVILYNEEAVNYYMQFASLDYFEFFDDLTISVEEVTWERE